MKQVEYQTNKQYKIVDQLSNKQTNKTKSKLKMAQGICGSLKRRSKGKLSIGKI
jgi:N-glycosylase/DNA lyase